ncbi:uncharacterized protein LOC142345324 isoform X2 [Convolutriloba macropyga]|uniref:uncharacterized protein LOC142345324 isoform X2 n=1 Tax=Convolutriloba macropyga TaxID=536237 RepID=UPI003F51CB2B
MDANSSTSESWDHEFPQSVWLENTLLVVKYGLLPIVVTSAILGNSVILTVITRFRVKRASLAYMALVATTHILQSFITLGTANLAITCLVSSSVPYLMTYNEEKDNCLVDVNNSLLNRLYSVIFLAGLMYTFIPVVLNVTLIVSTNRKLRPLLRVNENEEETEQSTAMRDAKEELTMSSSLIYGVATTICTPIVGLTLFFNAAINQEIWQPFQSNYKNFQLGLALHYIASCLPSINSTAAFFVLVITDDTLKREIKKLAMTVAPHHESTQNRDNENPRQVTKNTSFKNPLSISWKGCEGIVEHPLAPQLNNRGPSYQVSSQESRNFGAKCSDISAPSREIVGFSGHVWQNVQDGSSNAASRSQSEEEKPQDKISDLMPKDVARVLARELIYYHWALSDSWMRTLDKQRLQEWKKLERESIKQDPIKFILDAFDREKWVSDSSEYPIDFSAISQPDEDLLIYLTYVFYKPEKAIEGRLSFEQS